MTFFKFNKLLRFITFKKRGFDMIKKSSIITLLLLFLSFTLFITCSIMKKGIVNTVSPDGDIAIKFEMKGESESEKYPTYSVSYKGKTILQDSRLGISFKEGGYLGKNLVITDVKKETRDETYTLICGKTKEARDYCNETIISLRENDERGRLVNLIFRAYNDGVAFRYVFPEQNTLKEFTINDEQSEFAFTGNPTAWILPLGKFTTSYENNYDVIPLKRITPDSIIGLPMLIAMEGGPWVAITEANLEDYAGMYISGCTGKPSTLVSNLSPYPEDKTVRVKGRTPHVTPWRVVMISENPGRLIESNIVTNLSDPCEIDDTSWIKPGKTAWDWWSGSFVDIPGFKYGMNTATMLHYVDFAAEMGLSYMLVDWLWYGKSNDSNEDITKSIKEVDIQKIIDYAKDKNVGILLWLYSGCVDKQMDKAFPIYEQWGVAGVKVDLMDRDDQYAVNFYHRMLKKSAEHHLAVDIHGMYKPTGLWRTYPHFITQEGVLGLEYSKWSERCNPDHECTIPFIRMLAGPMDFTPGSFGNATKEQFKPVKIQPVSQGTRCHQLAMYVVYESPLQMLCDYPGRYRNQPGIDFLKVVPTTWNETKFINGEVGDYIAIARKNGDEWYVGCMTDWTPRELEIPLNFLSDSDFTAEMYGDAPDADKDANKVEIKQFLVTAKDKIKVKMAPGGGFAMRLRPFSGGLALPRYKKE